MKEEIEAKKEQEIYLSPVASKGQNRDLKHSLSKKLKPGSLAAALKDMGLIVQSLLPTAASLPGGGALCVDQV